MSHLYGVGLQIEVNKINNNLRMQLAKRGKLEFGYLNSLFKEMDTNKNGVLEPEEFEHGLATFGIFPTKVQLQTIFKYYDKNGDGSISYEEFVTALREPLTGRRLDVVMDAWTRLDTNKSGSVSRDELFAAFNVSTSQDFISGKTTKEELFAACGFNDAVKGNMITKQAFVDLYTDVSVSIDETDFFVQMVSHCWE
jgi:calcyphosin